MGMKRTILVLSSSDEDEQQQQQLEVAPSSTSLIHRSTRSKTKPYIRSVGSSTNSSKKRPRCQSHPLPPRKLSQEVSFDTLCEDFYDDFQGLTKLTGSRGNERTELWVEKYKPRSLEELAVHKKKVEEVRMWLKERLITSKEEFGSRALVITGQAGVGKSATIHVIASHLGATLCEWDTPTPTLWQEHLHNSSSGIRYMSKLDEFENFVERTRKYPLLPFSSNGSSIIPLLLIDDLPMTNGRVAHGRLCHCLHILARTAQIPTVILITDYTKADSADNKICHLEDLQSSLETAGASKVAFNPLTVNSIKKALSRICREEQCNVTAEQMDQIAKSSGGDIRNAITSLQYFCLKPGQILSPSTPKKSRTKDKSYETKPPNDGFTSSFGRDETLSLFHALGKFLHNKRETVHTTDFGEDVFLLSEQFARLPLKMDAPEKVLSQAHGQARNITDFLHENVLDFLGEEAIDDAWTVASYICDADNLLATSHRITNTYELESVAQLAAASVAVRGVMFGNSHPGPSRWHAIRSPKLWQVERSSRHNKNEMVRERNEGYSGFSLCDRSVMATEYKPVLKWLKHRASSAPEVYQDITTRGKWATNFGGHKLDLDDEDAEALVESEGDEIEDW